MTKNNAMKSITMWQSYYKDEGVSEPALVITPHSGNIISINQEGREILINTASISEFIKNIRVAAKSSEEL